MKTKTERRDPTAGIDVFLGFQLRIKSLEFLAEEVRRLKKQGEDMLEELATLTPTGDVLVDGRRRAWREEQLEEIFESYSSAVNRLGWELSH